MNKKNYKVLFVVAEFIAFISVFYLTVVEQGSFELYVVKMCLVLLILLCIFAIWFYDRFRKDDVKYRKGKKRVAYYTKDRRDIEEKISSLQTLINNSNMENWCDNNRLPISVQYPNVQDSDERYPLYLEEFKKNFGITEDIPIDPKLVFMIMPFNNDATKVYLGCKEPIESMGLMLKKSDDEYVIDDLLRHIIKLILSSEYIIANLDGKNPNVFYELGIAHSLGKKTILISSFPPSEIPFNVSNRNIIFYKDIDDLANKLKNVFHFLRGEDHEANI